jgi:G3E family GTPase
MRRTLKLPIPVTIITGGLGTGKTTVLRHLVAAKPRGEVWAVVVNEFGAVGVDGAAIEGAAAAGAAAGSDSADPAEGEGSVTIRQIAGGCMCCVTSGLLTPAIAQLLRQVKPDRCGRVVGGWAEPRRRFLAADD